uniref:thiol oxidase n=1 Tax=viral metagenome TaxID=1070528 RepID=A0A6C0BNG1_9ZZZZ
MSNNGFSTLVWGPALWTVLHCISFNYPVHPTEEDKNHYFVFMLSLGDVLPCGVCRRNYMRNLLQLEFSRDKLKDRETFGQFIYQLHRHISDLTQGSFDVPYFKLRENFEIFRAKCGSGSHRGCVSTRCRLVQRIVPPQEGLETFIIDEKCKE